MSKKIFAKPYRGVGEQVQQFADRGMVIDISVDEAAAVLRSVTYYRFSGYALPFRDVASGSYTGDLKFSDVVALYHFDCRLRELVGNALGAVEVTLRTILADELSSKYGPLGYLDAAPSGFGARKPCQAQPRSSAFGTHPRRLHARALASYRRMQSRFPSR